MLTSIGRGTVSSSTLLQRAMFAAVLAASLPIGSFAESAAALPDAPSTVATQSATTSTASASLQSLPLFSAEAPAVLSASVDPQQEQAPQQPQTAPEAQAPSLSDLGITNKEVQADPDLQARLDRRSHMLKVHQRWGLITLVPMAAACISSIAAGPDPKKGGNDTWRDVHLALGATTAVSYGITASYAIRAPRVPHGQTRGAIKLHKILAWVHGPGMIATPILGAMAYNQAADGHKPTGAAAAHGAIATTTVIAYGAALLAVSLPIRMGGH